MTKNPLFLKVAHWRMLSLFRSYFEKLQSRIVLIAIIALCIASPTSLAAFYRELSSFQSFLAWIAVSFISVSLILIHGKIGLSYRKIRQFENTLPISWKTRLTLDYFDSLWIQLPAVIFILLGALSDRFDFHHEQKWSLRFSVGGATLATLLIAWIFGRVLSVSKIEFRLPQFYFSSAVMKTKAVFKNYPAFSQSTLLWITILSVVGQSVARAENKNQPKAFLYFTFFGLQILPLSKIPALLESWDKELRPILNTLPGKTPWANSLPFLIPATLLLLETAFWYACSYHQITLLLNFVIAASLTTLLFFFLQMRLAKWALMIGILATLTGATVLQASVK